MRSTGDVERKSMGTGRDVGWKRERNTKVVGEQEKLASREVVEKHCQEKLKICVGG